MEVSVEVFVVEVAAQNGNKNLIQFQYLFQKSCSDMPVAGAGKEEGEASLSLLVADFILVSLYVLVLAKGLLQQQPEWRLP